MAQRALGTKSSTRMLPIASSTDWRPPVVVVVGGGCGVTAAATAAGLGGSGGGSGGAGDDDMGGIDADSGDEEKGKKESNPS